MIKGAVAPRSIERAECVIPIGAAHMIGLACLLRLQASPWGEPDHVPRLPLPVAEIGDTVIKFRSLIDHLPRQDEGSRRRADPLRRQFQCPIAGRIGSCRDPIAFPSNTPNALQGMCRLRAVFRLKCQGSHVFRASCRIAGGTDRNRAMGRSRWLHSSDRDRRSRGDRGSGKATGHSVLASWKRFVATDHGIKRDLRSRESSARDGRGREADSPPWGRRTASSRNGRSASPPVAVRD